MKYIKNHLMFIFPLMAILLGIEFYLVFDRTTDTYEKGLQEGYSMLVVTKEPMKTDAFRALNRHISKSESIERNSIVSRIAKGVTKEGEAKILKSLPYFYNVHLNEYISTGELIRIKEDLELSPLIKKVETFGSNYESNYRLFSFIKFTLKIFIGFMSVVSLFLIMKQMEIWKYAHKERMQIMEIFGAPLMLRSGVLFKIAIIDAIAAALIVSSIFLYLKFYWAVHSGIEIMIQNRDYLFRITDIGILLAAALLIVIISVYSVVYSTKGVEE
ncbi:cell division protein FtsX [Sulfurovum sp.]|jgi:cell division transport system permease protein|uniref:cell division protein FtsX n=1 Tax=Sulfurovum sp. TaxID=1969726 RepID=UPI002A3595A8|nr:cell division protein FtsX [Sulfurovum sp.]MDD3500546.1 cell division protein FtsX [Sulfurovum sp.]